MGCHGSDTTLRWLLSLSLTHTLASPFFIIPAIRLLREDLSSLLFSHRSCGAAPLKMDDLHYLEPGFDPASLTVPNLRNILVMHDIDYPSSAKKPQLIDLFNDHVKPMAKKLLAARAKVRRSASGIENVYMSREAYEDDDDDRETTPVASVRASRQSSRFSSRAATEESEAPSVAHSVASRRSTRQSSVRASDVSEAETETPRQRSTARRVRKSIATPAPVKEESPALDDESPFSNENIFQSGSSPMADAQWKRRSTLGPITSPEKKRTSTGRAKADRTSSARKSQTFRVPVANDESDESDEDDVVAGEQFVPEEEMILAAEAERNGGKDVLPARRRKQRSSSGNIFKGALAILAVMSSGVFYKWREEKLVVGYCGVGRPSTSIGGVEIPEWAPEWVESILPTCEPCPPHAYCHKDLKANCETDFVIREHPLSLWGAVPLPPTCEPDGEKVRKVQAVADRAVEVLRERNAKYECGELKDESGKKAEAPLPEPELKATVSAARRRSLSQEEFEDIWQSVLPELRSRDEIVSGEDGTATNQPVRRPYRSSGHTTFRSISHARISFGCSLRRSIRATLAEYLRYIVMIALVAGGAAYARYSFRSSRTLEAKGKQLAGFALDRLATQAALHADGRAPEPFIAVNQLRDDVLRDEFSRKSREAVWERVRGKVEGNANVRSSMKETRTGDMARVWEWIGAIDAIDDDGSPWASSGISRRKSGRYSLGPGGAVGSIEDTPSAQLRERSQSPRKSEMIERKVWDDSRPVY
ncbi:hypothetical protein FH972_023117 [Carpinus fangiana]|uniref:LEM-like domain-containing protein n=1 Tax=Carpinus fangiana TaxID=176857 RepID=A0A5N6KWJ0_9ROSI|nr:hypothetical protein FH972_023117 [Carpinus fangiana]